MAGWYHVPLTHGSLKAHLGNVWSDSLQLSDAHLCADLCGGPGCAAQWEAGVLTCNGRAAGRRWVGVGAVCQDGAAGCAHACVQMLVEADLQGCRALRDKCQNSHQADGRFWDSCFQPFKVRVPAHEPIPCFSKHDHHTIGFKPASHTASTFHQHGPSTRKATHNLEAALPARHRLASCAPCDVPQLG